MAPRRSKKARNQAWGLCSQEQPKLQHKPGLVETLLLPSWVPTSRPQPWSCRKAAAIRTSAIAASEVWGPLPPPCPGWIFGLLPHPSLVSQSKFHVDRESLGHMCEPYWQGQLNVKRLASTTREVQTDKVGTFPTRAHVRACAHTHTHAHALEGLCPSCHSARNIMNIHYNTLE